VDQPITDQITIDAAATRGYTRSPELQSQFDAAAKRLLNLDAWRTEDGQAPPGAPELRCDLALEGGGVKGIALVGAVLALDEAGYKIQRVAGTSAGAIAATLIAAIVQRGKPMIDLKHYLDTMEFAKFMPEGKIHGFLDRIGHRLGELTADFSILLTRMGLYPGTYLYEWLGPILRELDAETFGKLRVTQTDDPGMSLPIERQYRLLVHTSDVTRRVLVRLPWDCNRYGKQPDSMAVVDAVRASMSIPFFFEPFKFEATEATVNVPMPGGRTAAQHYAGGTVTWVDGGMLRNFPITAFDRIDGKPPRWPTIGIKLNSFDADSGQTIACAHTLGLATDCVQTMMNEWDAYAIESATAARTIFINNDGITATQFDLDKAQQDSLFKNGVAAATEFIIDMGRLGYVPKDADQALQLAQLRVALTAAAPPPSP
jgi:NTE family protein